MSSKSEYVTDPPDIDKLFSSAEDLLDEAKEAEKRFEKLSGEFVHTYTASVVRDHDAKAGRDLIKIRGPRPPRKMRRKAYTVVSAIRHSLDQAVYAATVCIDGKAKGSKTYFPAATDLDDFDKLFARKGRCQHVATRIIPKLKSFEPWWPGLNHIGGNSVLRLLLKISGPMKHQVALGATVDYDKWYVRLAEFYRPSVVETPPERIGRTNEFLVCSIPTRSKFKYEGNFSFLISIPEFDTSPLKLSAERALTEFVGLGVEIVRTIKDEVRIIVGP